VFKPLIHENILLAMQTILTFCAEAKLELSEESNVSGHERNGNLFVHRFAQKSRDFIKTLYAGDTVVDAQIALVSYRDSRRCDRTSRRLQHIKRLWADPAVQKAYTRRSEFQLIDSAQL
jgi:hypothetical protein